MNRFIRRQLRTVKEKREWLNQFKRWPLILTASIVWGIAGWQIYRTEFLAGFWGITNDEIAVVTIEKDGGEDTSTETIIIQDPSKSFWDGLELLGVPLVLAVLGAWFQKSQQEQAERTAREQREQDADETREEVLQLYFDRISTLLIDKNLMAIASKGGEASPESKELLEASLDVIRARTLSILRRFEKDIDRKSSVIRFLAEAEIISKLKLDLNEANLNEANLNGINFQEARFTGINLNRANLIGTRMTKANLKGARLIRTNFKDAHLIESDFSGAYLREANLKGARLIRTNFEDAHLMKANLIRTDFEGARLSRAYLALANLTGANFEGANLIETYFEDANLMKADLIGAKLIRTNLRGANLEGADLEGADLEGADLEGADLKNIYFNNETIWPKKKEVAKAKNIPIELQRQLGLIPEPPQKQPTDQHLLKPPQ